MFRVIRIAALAVLAACPGGDDDGTPDAAVPSGLVIDWTTAPAVPGTVSADISVATVELELSSLRVVGDAAPGDERTTASGIHVGWEAGIVPDALAFPQAPAGLYARVELGTGGEAEHYDLGGRVNVDGTDYDFRIEDEVPLSISLPVDVAVTAGATTAIGIVFDAGAVLAAVPFDQIPPDGGEIRLESGDPQIAAVRTAMASAFRIAP